MTSPIASPPEKSSLQSFQRARDRWQKSPRKKLSPMPQTPLKSPPPRQKILPPSAVEKELFQRDKTPEKVTLSEVETNSSSDATTLSAHRDRLVAFYKKYNPAKLDSVDATLSTYRGTEDILFQKLEAKYVMDDIPPPSGTGPTCFLEFQEQGRRVEVLLFADKAPLACDNFRALCTGEKGVGRSGKPLCFRNSAIHRIVPNFCIQGGDFTKGDGTGGESIYPPNTEHGDMWGKFKDEPFMRHDRKGLLSMANNGANRNGSQFFVTLAPLPHLDGKHVVFGEVTSGMDVIEQISQIPTDKKQQPLERVAIVDCGEIRDGKDIRESETSNAVSQQGAQPFAFASASPFGSVSSTDAKSTPFAFSASASKPISFGAGPSSTATPFSFPSLSSKSQPIAAHSSEKFSFAPCADQKPTADKTGPPSFSSVSLDANAPSGASLSDRKDTQSLTEKSEAFSMTRETEADPSNDSIAPATKATSSASTILYAAESKTLSSKASSGSDASLSTKEQESPAAFPRRIVHASRTPTDKEDVDEPSFTNPSAAINLADKGQAEVVPTKESESTAFASLTVGEPAEPSKTELLDSTPSIGFGAATSPQDQETSAAPSRRIAVAARKRTDKADKGASSLKNPFAGINFADKVQSDASSTKNPFAGFAALQALEPPKSLPDESTTTDEKPAKSSFSFGQPQAQVLAAPKLAVENPFATFAVGKKRTPVSKQELALAQVEKGPEILSSTFTFGSPAPLHDEPVSEPFSTFAHGRVVDNPIHAPSKGAASTAPAFTFGMPVSKASSSAFGSASTFSFDATNKTSASSASSAPSVFAFGTKPPAGSDGTKPSSGFTFGTDATPARQNNESDNGSRAPGGSKKYTLEMWYSADESEPPEDRVPTLGSGKNVLRCRLSSPDGTSGFSLLVDDED